MKNDRRQQIMEAAEKLFVHRRFHEVTLDEVAQSAKVGKGTIYRYFADKNDLFFETATAGFDRLCEVVKRSASEGKDAEARLLQACRDITAFFDQRRPLVRLMIAEESRMLGEQPSLRKRWFERRQALVAALAEILRQGAANGTIREDLPAEMLASYLLGLLRTRANDLASLPSPWQRIEPMLDLFLAGARPRRDRGAQGRKDQ